MAIDQFPFRVVSGFRPTRGLHIGHYAAVIADLVRDQYAHKNTAFVFVADHHARSKWSQKADFASLGDNAIQITRGLLALGLDPEYSVLYRQSDISEIFEPMWFFAGMVGDGVLRRGHAVKNDAAATVGTYLYPMLMVSDILSLKATHVAIGHDQKQHLELARDIARKIAARLGRHIVPVPESLRENPILVPGIDSAQADFRKMAIENSNDIPIFAEDEDIRQRIERILTRNLDWGEQLPLDGCNILNFAEVIGGQPAISFFQERYRGGKYGYRQAKVDLTDLFFDTFSKARERYFQIEERDVVQVLMDGAKRARSQFAPLLFELRKIVRGKI